MEDFKEKLDAYVASIKPLQTALARGWERVAPLASFEEREIPHKVWEAAASLGEIKELNNQILTVARTYLGDVAADVTEAHMKGELVTRGCPEHLRDAFV